MDLPAADDGQEVVAQTLDAQSALQGRAFVAGHLDGALITQEVRCGQEVHVEHVALDPFGAIKEAAELSGSLRDLHAEQPLQAVDRAHLVGDRADPADPRNDVGHLREVAAREEGFEEARGLVDLQAQVLDLGPLQREVKGALPFDACDRGYLYDSVRGF